MVDDRKRYVLGVTKIPADDRDLAHRLITDQDDRGFFDVIGADTPDDDPTHPIGSPTTYVLHLTDDEAEQCRAASNVRYVEEDQLAEPTHYDVIDTVIPSDATLSWAEDPAATDKVWHGRNVPVAVLDQGTTGKVRCFMGWCLRGRRVFGANPGWREVWPGHHHGCLTATSAVPKGGMLYDCLVAEPSGGAYASSIAAGLKWAADQGCRIMSLSYGARTQDPSSAYPDAFTYLANRNAHVYISAGNDGLGSLSWPAAYSYTRANVHSVIAFDQTTGARAPFSNYQLGASGSAPGVNLLGLNNDGKLVQWSGTSAAAPLVAGLNARAATNNLFTPHAAAQALNAPGNLRDTGQPSAEQGNGAYSLTKTLNSLRGIITAPDIVVTPPPRETYLLPRLADGQADGVSDFLNACGEEIDRLGVGCVVRRTSTASLPTGVDQLVSWQALDLDTAGAMWSPQAPEIITIRVPGIYTIIAQVRFGQYATTGRQAIRILLGGSNPATNTIGVDKKPSSNDGEAVTCSSTITTRLFTGQQIRLSVWQNTGAAYTWSHTDFGGTFLALSRSGPY